MIGTRIPHRDVRRRRCCFQQLVPKKELSRQDPFASVVLSRMRVSDDFLGAGELGKADWWRSEPPFQSLSDRSSNFLWRALVSAAASSRAGDCGGRRQIEIADGVFDSFRDVDCACCRRALLAAYTPALFSKKKQRTSRGFPSLVRGSDRASVHEGTGRRFLSPIGFRQLVFGLSFVAQLGSWISPDEHSASSCMRCGALLPLQAT